MSIADGHPSRALGEIRASEVLADKHRLPIAWSDGDDDVADLNLRSLVCLSDARRSPQQSCDIGHAIVIGHVDWADIGHTISVILTGLHDPICDRAHRVHDPLQWGHEAFTPQPRLAAAGSDLPAS